MKITKRQLRRIIREEKQKILLERAVSVQDTAKGLPSAASLGKSLSDLDPQTALNWIAGLMSSLDFSGAAAELPPPPPEPPVEPPVE